MLSFNFNFHEKDTSIRSWSHDPYHFLTQLRNDFNVIIKKIAEINCENSNSNSPYQKLEIVNLNYNLEIIGEDSESLHKMQSESYRYEKDDCELCDDSLSNNVFKFDDKIDKLLLCSKVSQDLSDLIQISRIKRNEATNKKRRLTFSCSMPTSCFLKFCFSIIKDSSGNDLVHEIEIEFGFDKDKGLFFYKNNCVYDLRRSERYLEEEDVMFLNPYTD